MTGEKRHFCAHCKTDVDTLLKMNDGGSGSRVCVTCKKRTHTCPDGSLNTQIPLACEKCHPERFYRA